MKHLSERNKTLLLKGQNMTGSMKEAYIWVEEDLYVDEALDMLEFCEWVDKEVGGCGRFNIDQLYHCFQTPDDPKSQSYVRGLKKLIAGIKAHDAT